MGTKTVDEAGAETGAEVTNDETKAEVTQAEETATEAAQAEETATEAVQAEETATEVTQAEETATEAVQAEETATEAAQEKAQEGPSGVGQGAGAVVSAGLGVISLSGSWVSTVASARATLLGQLRTQTTAGIGSQIKAVYGDAWQATALWGGLFALAALIVGVVVLARPAFGAPGKPQAAWIKSVAWGGIALGVIGLLLAVLKYTDILLGLPSVG
ncbi:hypothetical protein [Streptomyces colonosanans]|uniref:Uncharacterized protein n=1 Tax=Streptomyces colonosanans TaxID=1428652 RepID=A0A1S2PN52_9ACTN|nr:hypothetical protein [Streptomyces colonosanans]OIJ95237.1 hypothetical protein BIV24_09485 [Streptomyces colonosanans]